MIFVIHESLFWAVSWEWSYLREEPDVNIIFLNFYSLDRVRDVLHVNRLPETILLIYLEWPVPLPHHVTPHTTNDLL